MSDSINQIYDKIFKKILTLSSVAVTNLINGLFGTDYPSDSTITYNWTEFHNESLKRVLADTILTINGCHSYHMEAQIERDNDIVFRVFEYGFNHSLQQRNKEQFPESTVQEINDRKLVILIPFQLLKLRQLMAKERSAENLTLLTDLIQNDIIGSIKRNPDAGNISRDDAMAEKDNAIAEKDAEIARLEYLLNTVRE